MWPTFEVLSGHVASDPHARVRTRSIRGARLNNGNAHAHNHNLRPLKRKRTVVDGEFCERHFPKNKSRSNLQQIFRPLPPLLVIYTVSQFSVNTITFLLSCILLFNYFRFSLTMGVWTHLTQEIAWNQIWRWCVYYWWQLLVTIAARYFDNLFEFITVSVARTDCKSYNYYRANGTTTIESQAL